MNVAEHPSDDDLAAFSAGKLNVVESDRIEQHLVNCEQCCQTLSGLPEDTLVVRLRNSDSDTKEDSITGSVIEQTMVYDSAKLTQAPDSDRTAFGDDTSNDLDLPAELVDHPRYRIARLLGHGGMGDVYLAEHKVMNRMVALKVIKPQLVQNDAAVRRFHREVQAAARLHHANIVAAYDAEQAGDLHYLVMEFVDGVDLNEVLKERGELPVAEAVNLVEQAAIGLAHAHELGMVHRDIKPHNLMVTRENASESSPGRVLKILDFGLANFASGTTAEKIEKERSESPTAASETLHHLTQMGTMMGTPDYIAPEQAEDAHTADIRADIYSLGCTFYTLLTGKAPFDSGSVLEKIKAHNETPPPPISDLRDDVPPAVAGVLNKMMAKSAADRYQTPQELIAALRATLPKPATKPVEVRPAAAPKSNTASWIIGGVSIVGLLGLLLLGCFAAIAVVVVITDRGKMTIVSEVDDVEIVLKDKGKVVKVIDLKSGTTVYWLDAGHYNVELKGDDNDVKIDTKGFQLSRLGHVIVKATWTDKDRDVFQSFDSDDKTITKDGVTVTDEGWEITNAGPRTIRLFETDLPHLRPGPFHYRAKLKSKDLKGKAYLEMWVRLPGVGESFSRGLDKTISGTNDWAEIEIPFYLRKGQAPDHVKLNLVVEGTGTVSIKDIELRGRIDVAEESIVELPLIRKWKGHVGPVKHVSFSPDGKFAASASGYPDGDRTAIIWNVETGEQLHQLIGHEHTVMCAEFSRDGKQLATSSYDATIRFWDVGSGKEIDSVTRNHAGEEFAFTIDGANFAHATYMDFELRSTKATEKVVWSKKTKNRIYAIAMHPDNERVLTGDNTGTITFWSLKTGEQLQSHKLLPSIIQEIDISPDGKTCLLAGDGWPVLHVDLKTGKSLRQFPGYKHKSAQFSPDGRFAAVSGPFSIIELATGKTIARLPEEEDDYGIWSVRFSPDGKTLLTAGGSVYDKARKGFVLQDDYDVRHWRLPESMWPKELAVQMIAEPTELSPAELHRLLSEAAGIPQEEWRKLGASPMPADDVTGEPLSFVLLTLDTFAAEKQNPKSAEDFKILTKGVPKPSEFAKAMSNNLTKGYASMIQPAYVNRTKETYAGETLSGNIEFEAEGIYRGKVDFLARWRNGKWRVEQFSLPNYKITIELNSDGQWQRVKSTETPPKVSG